MPEPTTEPTVSEVTDLLRDLHAIRYAPFDDPARADWIARKEALLARIAADAESRTALGPHRTD